MSKLTYFRPIPINIFPVTCRRKTVDREKSWHTGQNRNNNSSIGFQFAVQLLYLLLAIPSLRLFAICTLGYLPWLLRYNSWPKKHRPFNTSGTNEIASLKESGTHPHFFSSFFFKSIRVKFIYMTILFYLLIPCLRWTMTHSQESRIRLDDMNMNCDHYSTVFSTCHFSMNCVHVDAVSLHKSWLSLSSISVSVLLNLHLICMKIHKFLKKNYLNIRIFDKILST